MRANGEGTVYQRGDGRWVASVLDPQTGRRRSTYASTEKAARRALSGMLMRKENGQVALDAGASLAVYGRAWVADRAGKRRRESTVREYGWRLEKYVYPVIGGRRLRELTALDVEDMLDTLAARKLSGSTLRAVRNALAAMLQDAVRARHLAYNVARSSQLPEDVRPSRPVVAPTDEQVAKLVRAAADTDLAPLLAVLVGTGARIGEAMGMTWADVDLDAMTWKVARTTTRDRNGSVALGKRTKTGASRELVLLPEVDELNSSHQIVHSASTQALAVGFAMLNLSPTFFSPDRRDSTGALMVNHHRQPSAVEKLITKVERLPRRSGPSGAGYDGLGIAIVELANDGSPVKLVSGPPAPPAGDPFNYDSMIRRVAHEYDTRFGGL